MFLGIFHISTSIQRGQQRESVTFEPKHGASPSEDTFQ